jgi:CO/xanthine dehydrogenase Mo-binding subunit
MVTSRPSSVVAPTAPSDPLAVPGVGRATGRPVARRDAPAKVTGAALYTDDLVVPGAWHGVTVRADEPHARLLGIDRDPTFDWSSVIVVTAADVPGENVVALLADDQPVLVAEEIRHVAEPVALIAAPDPATARAARDAMTLRTDPLPPVLDALAADRAIATYEIVHGDVDAALASADLVVEGTYRVGHQEQLYLEPQAMIAIPRPDGGITIHGSLQCPYYVHTALGRALALDPARIVVIQRETGGGFGGKEEFPSGLAIHAALLALRAGRPVRMVYDRHEDIAATTKRHPAVVTHRTGVMRDGRLVAQDIDVVMDAGAYATTSPVVLSRGALHAGGPYSCADVRIRARAMATNTPPNGAFRGFGAPQTEFAAEMQANRVAEALDLSPAELRRRWAYREGDETPTGQMLRSSVAAVAVLDRAAEAGGFEDARARTREHARSVAAEADEAARTSADASDSWARTAHGVGLALGWHGAGFTGSGEAYLASVAAVELTASGEVRVLTDATEIGQGSRTVLAQLAADALGIPVDDVEVAPADTSIVPNSGPTVASRTTMIVGGLVIRAAERLRAEMEARTGRPFAESRRAGARTHGALRIDERFGGFPGIEWDPETYRGDAYPCFSWSGVVAQVDVDLDTGEVAVTSVVQAVDAGRIVNPLLAAGQVEGGTLQAVGYATSEEMRVADGRFVNDRLATYLIPTALDAPRIEAHFVEAPFPDVPHGAKGLGELPMDAPAAAIVAAIQDATGAWITELPATPERVLAAIRAVRKAAR